ncbi:hypothetical protein [Anaerobium acetethylicum]|uniref:Nucleotidyltransferase domain-containing protein n=1 Tax=Anaerobium acetethylicum TaxID=1619234 RepID=A0A1D3TUB9_9FIRM|nr:hypothetical protein [Anaerobium acetethylicum]SCP97613.1 hypothetical protein SAMN05421730_101236 [Anaerobium acetethylicum]
MNKNTRADMSICSLARMDELTKFFKRYNGVKAIMGFGSLGDLRRFDDYSDLDFLLVCTSETRTELLENLDNMQAVAPIAYAGIEGEDTVKLLFMDGVLCDFGIVTEEQLQDIPHTSGRFLWKKDGFSDKYADSTVTQKEKIVEDNWCGNVLIEVYVGLLRELRGEKAAAFEKIQYEAVRKLLSGLYGNKNRDLADEFSSLRRAEQLGAAESILKEIMPGYGKNAEAARAIIRCLPEGEDLQKLLEHVNDLIKACEDRQTQD